MELFAGLKSEAYSQGTKAIWKDDEAGMSYTFIFEHKYHYSRFDTKSVQVLSRVFLVEPKRMKGRDPNSWLDALRWSCVRAEQHSFPPRLDLYR